MTRFWMLAKETAKTVLILAVVVFYFIAEPHWDKQPTCAELAAK
jgi:hypothetical protein